MSEPSITFDPVSTDFGSIDVGESCGYESYHMSVFGNTVKNLSIFIIKSIVGKSEFIDESWIWYKKNGTSQVVAGSETAFFIGNIESGSSIAVYHKVVVPSDASSSGDQPFFGKHKYQYT